MAKSESHIHQNSGDIKSGKFTDVCVCAEAGNSGILIALLFFMSSTVFGNQIAMPVSFRPTTIKLNQFVAVLSYEKIFSPQ